jgi:hypothetical protein
MAETIDRGPFISVGSLMDNRVENFDGPSMSYQGDSFPDVRFGPFPKDGTTPARAFAFFNNPYVVLTDAIPSATTATAIATSQVATGGLAMLLVTATPGGSAAGVPSVAPGVPIIPFGQTAATTVLALDFGFATGTTVAASSTVVVVDNTYFPVGTWIVIGGAGNASGSAPLITQVQSIIGTTGTGITVSPSPATAISNAPIGHGNLFSNLLPPQASFGPAQSSANAATPYTPAGFAALFNPLETVTRNIAITGTNATSTAQFLVTGYDIYGQLMTEQITGVNGSAAGKKAFKYIKSIVPQGTATGNSYSVGVGNIAGIHLRSDKWEYMNLFYSGQFASTSAGWTAAITTSPATNTTGDVRGTINAATLTTAFNGTSRLAIMMSVPIYNMVNATPLNATSLFGVAQSTT